MSVALHLYKIRDDIEYKGILEDKVKWTANDMRALEEIEKSYGYRGDFSWEELINWKESLYPHIFSDGKKHEVIDLTYFKEIYKGKRGLSGLLKKFQNFNIRTFTNANSYTYKYLVLDEVVYRQGWFLKRRFFHKNINTVICLTKKEMVNFFNKYIDYNSRDTRGKEAVDTFLDNWKPGMIFECSW